MPETLGRFQIVRRLGQGAQSVVYLAFDPQLHREVAVKALRGSADTAATLLNEARAVSRLSHAAIVPVFEAAQSEGDGTAYLVFEYVPGPTLADVLRQQGALEPMLAVKMLLPVLDAVAYAHANDVIHRDLKPSNILMDRRGLARVMDFGIAVRQMGTAQDPAQGDADGLALAPVGTPAYMAPEYIQFGQVSPQMDVFSAGLVLFEMLMGRRAVQAEGGLQAMHFVVNHDISLPETPPYPVDDRLRAILGRALAREPSLRYATMADFASALREWVEPQAEPLPSADVTQSFGGGRVGAMINATAQAVALEAVLRRIRLKSELPALPDCLAQITRLASSDRQNLGVLTSAVLCDFAVTQKLLRMVNSAMYRSFGGGSVSTVSRAIQLLGYAAVRTAATSLPLLATKDPVHAARVLDDRLIAYFCGVVADDLSGLRERDAEEAFVCASLHRLGPSLVRFYFPEEAAEVERLSQGQAAHRDRAMYQVLGLSDEALGMGVAKHWGLPEVVLRSMRKVVDTVQADGTPEVQVVATPATRAELLRTLSSFAAELAQAWMQETPERRQAAIAVASQRFAKALALTTREIKSAIATAEAAATKLCHALRQDLRHSEVARRLGLVAGHPVSRPKGGDLPAVPGTAVGHAGPFAPAVSRDGAGDEEARARCRDALANGIQSLTNRLLETFKLNDVVMDMLRILQDAAGFRQVLFCVRDPRTHTLIGRLAASGSALDKAGQPLLVIDDSQGVLASVISRGEDVWVPDLANHALGLQWSAACRPGVLAGSVLLLPLMLKGHAIGLVYADRAQANEGLLLEGRELALIATLRNQVALAFRQRSF